MFITLCVKPYRALVPAGQRPWAVAMVVVVLLSAALPLPASAQRRTRVDQGLMKNSPVLLKTVADAAGPAGNSAVRILVNERPVALGTIVRSDGYILTKASELHDGFVIELYDGQRFAGEVVGVMKEHDLAAVKIEASELQPATFSISAVNAAGSGQWVYSPGVGEDGILKIGNLSVKGLRRIPGNGSLLGVQLAPQPQQGIPVFRVDKGGPAERAGLEPGDLILGLNGMRVGTMRDFVRLLRNGPPDASHEVTLSRGGRQLTFTITLDRGQAGVTLVTEASGVLVEQVTPGSGAEAAGVLPGDIIIALDDRQVRDRPALISMVQSYDPGDTVDVTFLRAGEEQTVPATLGYHTGRSIRGEFQNQLGSQLSARAVDFPAVLQHDSILNANQMGGPLVDLKGQVLGINIARAGRVETYALPAQVIEAAIPALISGKLTTATAPAVTESGQPPAQTPLGDQQDQ